MPDAQTNASLFNRKILNEAIEDREFILWYILQGFRRCVWQFISLRRVGMYEVYLNGCESELGTTKCRPTDISEFQILKERKVNYSIFFKFIFIYIFFKN